MAEMVTTMMPEAMMDFLMNGRDQSPIGNRDDSMAPHGVFPAAGDDQWIAIAIASDDEFAKLCEVARSARAGVGSEIRAIIWPPRERR